MGIAIKYTRRNVRELGELVWNRANRWTQVVEDIALAADLLTYPTPQFELAPGATASKAERAQLARLMGVDSNTIDQLFAGSAAAKRPPGLEEIEGLSDSRAAQLKEDFKIATAAELAAIDDKQLDNLIKHSGAQRSEIENWILKAQKLVR